MVGRSITIERSKQKRIKRVINKSNKMNKRKDENVLRYEVREKESKTFGEKKIKVVHKNVS